MKTKNEKQKCLSVCVCICLSAFVCACVHAQAHVYHCQKKKKRFVMKTQHKTDSKYSQNRSKEQSLRKNNSLNTLKCLSRESLNGNHIILMCFYCTVDFLCGHLEGLSNIAFIRGDLQKSYYAHMTPWVIFKHFSVRKPLRYYITLSLLCRACFFEFLL